MESVKDYAIFMVDRDGHVQTWNAAAEIIKGYSADEIIGRRIDLLYTPEARAQELPQRLLATARDQGRAEDQGWRLRKDGTRFWADVVITALRDESGALVGYAKVTRDLTERRNIESQLRLRQEQLQRSEERFRLLVDTVEDHAIFMMDPSGVVTTWNSGAQRINGYTASEIIGQHFSVFRVEGDVDRGSWEAELREAERTGRVESEGARRRKDGTTFVANVSLTAVRNEAGELIGFAKVMRDLTQRRMLEEERLHRARAEEAVRLREEFLSIASHELRTPLTALQIDLYAIKEHLAGQQGLSKKIERATRNADRLAALIESLLNVSRIAGGKLTLKLTPMDLAHAVGLVMESMRASAAKVGCELTLQAPIPVRGSWDRLRVDQITTNLLANALKYGAGAPVVVSVATEGDHAVMEVADRGPGIPEADLTRIFERFERASSLRHYGGLGLGLYVSREIVRAFQGSISASNRVGGGACFTVRLPLRPPLPPEASGPARTG